MRTRSKGRALALQYLYQMEIRKDHFDQESVELFYENMETTPESIEYANKLLKGVFEKMDAIDEVISEYLKNWDLKRISIVDKNILRLATFELMYFVEVPAKVAVNEAIELGKLFGSKDSSSFINGVLDKILKTKIML